MIPVFETVLVDARRIRLRAHHLERLARSGATPAQVAAVDACFAEALDLDDQPFVLRVDVDDAGVRPSTRPPRPATPVDLLLHRSYDPADATRLRKTADRAWADTAEADAGGEALLVAADGRIGETTRASVLVLRPDGRWLTPRLEGILPGVTRAWAIGEIGAEEEVLHLDDLRAVAGAALLTAGRGVVPIASIEGIALPRAGAIEELAARWRALP